MVGDPELFAEVPSTVVTTNLADILDLQLTSNDGKVDI